MTRTTPEVTIRPVEDQNGRWHLAVNNQHLGRLGTLLWLHDEWRALTKAQKHLLVAVAEGTSRAHPTPLQRLRERRLVDGDALTLTNYGRAVLWGRP